MQCDLVQRISLDRRSDTVNMATCTYHDHASVNEFKLFTHLALAGGLLFVATHGVDECCYDAGYEEMRALDSDSLEELFSFGRDLLDLSCMAVPHLHRSESVTKENQTPKIGTLPLFHPP